MKKKLLGIALALVMTLCAAPLTAFAVTGNTDGGQETAKRTILLYTCGADLESRAGMASFNYKQILKSKFSSDDDINVIVMTGGSTTWQLDNNEDAEDTNPYLTFPEDVAVPDDAVMVPDMDNMDDPYAVKPAGNNKGSISNVYNQIWEARGADAVDENGNPDPNAGKLVLLDGDGLTGKDGKAIKNEDELMTDPATLKAFINYGVQNYPAEKYDLIFWDHGGGPAGGYGSDENYNPEKTYPNGVDGSMSFREIVSALSDNMVVDRDGDGSHEGMFDFINFDACLMGNVELALVLADYTNYYIASCDTEPGYGQYYGPGEGSYKGWLDELGKSEMDAVYNAADGSYALGKVIADDLHNFYSDDNSKGAGDNATLAVFDTQKMIGNTEFIGALNDLAGKLKSAAEGAGSDKFMFYDELKSYYKSINYTDTRHFDLADMVAYLGVADLELEESTDQATEQDYTNSYAELSKTFGKLFPRADFGDVMENDFMYARYTINEKTEDNYYYDEEAAEQRTYGILFSTGMSVFFPDGMVPNAPVEYCKEMSRVIDSMSVKDDGRYAFLKEYKEVVADYGLILLTGQSVTNILNTERAFYPDNNPYYGDKSKITPDAVMDYWSHGDNNMWTSIVSKYLEQRQAGVEGSRPWLNKMIRQMAEEALLTEGIDVTEIQHEGTNGYRVEVKEGNERLLQSVDQEVVAELPVLNQSIEKLSPKAQRMAKRHGNFTIGSLEGYNDSGNVWEITPLEQKWYAVNDAEGNNHVAMIYRKTSTMIAVPALIGSEDDGKAADRYTMLEFDVNADKNGSHKLLSIYMFSGDNGPRRVNPASLTQETTFMPIMYLRISMGSNPFYLPISKNSFTISKENADSITLDFADIKNIPDIEDTTGDGKSLTSTFTITDLYKSSLDISDRVNTSLKHISLAKAKPAVFNGKEQVPEVVYDGKTLTEGVDYTWEKVPDVTGQGENEKFVTPKFKNARKYEVLLTGKGEFTGFINTPFVIKKAANPLSVKGKTAKAGYKSLSKANQNIKAAKALKFEAKGKGKTTYVKKSKSAKLKNITINKKTGKITLKKGMARGTYKVAVRIKAAGNKNYKAATRTVSVRIIVR